MNLSSQISNPSIYTLTSEEERKCLSELAKEVPENGVILEIGALYGGVTSILALSAPYATVFTIDNFSWHPEGYPKTSKALLLDNMKSLDIANVRVIEGKSRDEAIRWKRHINLLWIDGGHDFKSVYFDLNYFAHFSEVIALHDYDNPAWKDIRQAVEVFLSQIDEKRIWYLDKVVGMVAVLRRK